MLFRFFRFSMCISSVSYSIHKICNEEMKKVGLKGTYVQYLAAMAHYREEGLTAARLCELCDRDKAAVSRALAEMEEKGLICRKEENEKMYRMHLFLTEKGMEMANFATDRVKCAVAQAVKGIPEEERCIFVKAFQTISDNLLDISQNGLPQD